VLWLTGEERILEEGEKAIVDLLPSICVISVVVKIGSVNEVDEITVVTKVVLMDAVVDNDVEGAGWLVDSDGDGDGDGEGTEVVTGLYVLTLVDVETLELSLLDVKTELDDGVETEVLTYGVLLVTWFDVVVIDVEGAGWLVDGDGDGDGTDVVTGLYVLTLVDVDTLELDVSEVKAELDDGVDTEVLTYGLVVLTT